MTDVETTERNPKRFKPPWIALTFAFVLLIVLVGKGLIPLLTGQVLVPNTVGQQVADAQSKLREAGFEVSVVSLVDEWRDDWLVTDQAPNSVRRTRGDTVEVVVTPPYISLPVVTGLQPEEASRLLTEAGFDVGEPVLVHDERFAAGLVIDVDGQAGQTMQGSAVQLRVSKGPQGLPDLRGIPAEDARRILQRFGIPVNKVIGELCDDLPDNSIIRTEPATGCSMEEARSSGIVIYISRPQTGSVGD
ncbi:MAG: PASTA domain-containing protein [Candidatus Cloacimonetes bacterium]|nr:PASTA domain-containing protein [Candidatus Cloacimonadota bacterium]